MKRYLQWLMVDGLLIQVYFGISSALAMALALCGCYETYSFAHSTDMPLAIAALLFVLFAFFFFISLLWGAAALCSPTNPIIKATLKVPLDGLDWIVIIVVPVLFLLAALITTFLKLAGFRGYPKEYYSNFYSIH